MAPRTSGSRIHGSTAAGQASTEIVPSTDSTRGLSAYASAASSRVAGVPMPSAPASLTAPVKPTTSTSAHQPRCTTQPGRPSSWPSQKNGPIGHR